MGSAIHKKRNMIKELRAQNANKKTFAGEDMSPMNFTNELVAEEGVVSDIMVEPKNTAEDLDALTYAQLKTYAKSVGVAAVGTKAELIEKILNK